MLILIKKIFLYYRKNKKNNKNVWNKNIFRGCRDFFKKNGVKTECKILDDKLYIQYNMKNIELNYIKKILSKKLNLNANFIKFEYVKKFLNKKIIN